MRTFIALALCLPAFAITATIGVPFVHAVTVSTTLGSDTVTATGQPEGDQQFEVGQIISIAGETGYKIVASYTQSGFPASISTSLKLLNDDQTPFSASATVSGLSIRLIGDYLDHTSVRIWNTTDVNACLSAWFDTSSHTLATDYQYRSAETDCIDKQQAVDIIGMEANTRYHVRLNSKTVGGADNTGAVFSADIAFTTPADTHGPDGRPPAPILPEEPTLPVNSPVDTSSYDVVTVPQFPDGVVTGTITVGSTSLVVNTIPAGMAVNQWIVVAGTDCGFGGSPNCKITNINSGTHTLTLNQAATATVSNAAVTWSLLTIEQSLYDQTKGYGTVFEWGQGYIAKVWRTDWQAGRDAVRIPGLPLDDNPSCATHPCAIDDPAHRWIVFRTAATPAALPPFGIRTGPEYASVLGHIQMQNPITTGFNLSEHANNGMPAHHVIFENLAYVPAPIAADEADPNEYYGFLATHWSAYRPWYILMDRLYIDTPNIHTRLSGMDWSGRHIALINSYLRAEYWRPWVAHYGPDVDTNSDPSISSNTITLPGFQWQRNRNQALVTQGSATITASGTASALVTVYIVMETAAGNGAEVRYSSGKGITITCPSCRAVSALSDPTPTATQKKIYYAEIANGATSFSSGSTFGDSVWRTEGPDGMNATNGDHWLLRNNHIESYNKGFFVDVPTPADVAAPSHITVRRNHFFWNTDHRSTSSDTNGFNYAVRHVGTEFKRGFKILEEGNEFEGGYAGVNHGPAITISETSFANSPVTSKVSDVTIRRNVFHNISESVAFNPHYVGPGSQYTSMGGDVNRVYVGHNLVYDQNAWRSHTHPGPYFYGRQGLFCGHDFVVEHNTVYDTYSILPTINLCGEDRVEGLWMTDNIWYGNVGAYGYLHVSPTDYTGLPRIPATTNGTIYSGANFDTSWNSFTSRLTGSGTINTFRFSSNVIICGSLQGSSVSDVHTMGSDVDYDSSTCATHQAKFGSLSSLNTFVTSPSTKAGRTSYVKWANTSQYDFRWSSGAPLLGALKTSDGLSIGANVEDIDSARGLIKQLPPRNIRDAGSGGCSGSAGTHCVTFTATVPDRGASCRVVYGAHGSSITGWTETSWDTSTTSARSITVQGLAAGIWDWEYQCAGMPPVDAASFTLP